MPMHPPAAFRKELATVLREEKKRMNGFLPLSRAIEAAYAKRHKLPPVGDKGKTPPYRIDRRKLRQLADSSCETNVNLTMLELEALELYLTKNGRSLKDVFEKRSLLKDLAASGRVTFLYGVRPRSHLTTASGWDMRSMAVLVNELGQTRIGVQLNLEEVQNHVPDLEDASEPATELTKGVFKKEKWYSLLRDVEGPSIVCLGSPVACHASEIVLAEMLDLKPFAPAKNRRVPPFYFALSEDRYHRLTSTFGLNGDELKEKIETKPDEDYGGNAWGIQTEEGLLPGPRRTSGVWTNYGIFAAQRRRTGQVWLVVAGVSGPMTFAVARYLTQKMTKNLPPDDSGQHSPVLWGVVKGAIRMTTTKNTPGDHREVLQEGIVLNRGSFSGQD